MGANYIGMKMMRLFFQSHNRFASYKRTIAIHGYDLGDAITYKLLVMVKMKFVSKVFSEIWHRIEVTSNRCLPFTVLLGIDPFECSSYAVFSKARACCMCDIASHYFSSVRCTNLLYFEKKNNGSDKWTEDRE